MATHVVVGILQRINETMSRLLSGLAQIEGNGLVDVACSEFTGNDRLDFQPRVRAAVALPTRARRPSK